MSNYRDDNIDATTGALALGFLAIGAVMSQAEKNRLKNLEEELRTNKAEWYSFHIIVGVTCSSCLSVTEEGQWECHMCGVSLA